MQVKVKSVMDSAKNTICLFLDEERKAGGGGRGECRVDLVVVLRTAKQKYMLRSIHQRFSQLITGSCIENKKATCSARLDCKADLPVPVHMIESRYQRVTKETPGHTGS